MQKQRRARFHRRIRDSQYFESVGILLGSDDEDKAAAETASQMLRSYTGGARAQKIEPGYDLRLTPTAPPQVVGERDKE